ncbi:MAG: response regulator, partial [Deltaproteobacteria bacterium]
KQPFILKFFPDFPMIIFTWRGGKVERTVSHKKAEDLPTGRKIIEPFLRLRSRIKERPDSEAEQALIRIVIVFLAYLFIRHYAVQDGFVDKNEFISTTYILGYLFLSIILFIYIVFFTKDVSPYRRIAGIFGDIVGTALVMYLVGKEASPLFIIYLWVTLGNGFRFGRLYLFISAALSVVCFGSVTMKTGYWQEHPNIAMGLLLGLIAIPGYVSVLLKKLNDSLHRAEEASRAKSQFLASMSHEMRTPLNGILGTISLIWDTPLDREQKRHISLIEDSARALLRLIEDVLDIAKIESGRFLLDESEFDLYETVRNSISIVQPLAATKKLELYTRFSPRIPFLVKGDPAQLQKVLINLLGNAVKFTEKGHVCLTADLVEENEERIIVRFEVEDTGIGIPPEISDRIFEPFTQADSSISRRYGGTGLGTTIAKNLVTLMGGEIGFQSEAGKGTTFWFTIPLKKQKEIPSEVESGSHLKGMRVLVVSKVKPLSRDIYDHLATWGVRATVVENIAQALALLVTKSTGKDGFDIVLVVEKDLEIDPVEFSHAVKAEPSIRTVKLIIATGKENPADQRRFVECGYSSCIPLPLNKALLFNALHLVRSEDHEGKGVISIARKYAEKRKHRKPIKILIAEDNETNREVIEKILRNSGYEPYVVPDGHSALDMLEKEKFHLAIFDVRMPELSGIDAVKIVRSHKSYPQIPIIALTADATVETKRLCEEAGFDSFLTKPISPGKLISLIEEIVGGGGETVSEQEETRGESEELSVEDIIDMDSIREYISYWKGTDFLERILNTFFRESEKKIALLREAVEKGDAGAFKDLAHSLKGSSGQIGATRLMGACIKGARITPLRFAEEGEAILRTIEEEYALAKEHLKKIIQKSAGKAID